MYSTSQNPRPTELSDLGQQRDWEVANSSDADHGIMTSPTTLQKVSLKKVVQNLHLPP
jgi:hypothetical protein